MSKAEFLKLAEAIKTAYPKERLLATKEAMQLWYAMLQDIDYQTAAAAVKAYIAVKKFPPTIAEIREMATVSEVQDWGTGWQKTLSVIRKYGWCRQKEALEELDELTRQTVQRLGYMELCTSDNLMADRGNFRMIYEQIAEREKDRQCLPEELQSRIKAMQERSIDDRRNTRRSAQLTERQADEAERNQPAVRTE